MFNPSPQANEGVAKSASEAQVSQIGSHAGTDTGRLVKDASRLLERDGRLGASVREGIAQAGREEFIGGGEMDPRIGCLTRGAYPVDGDRDASQTRDYCVAKNATHRAARPDPSLRKERLLGMTIEIGAFPKILSRGRNWPNPPKLMKPFQI